MALSMLPGTYSHKYDEHLLKYLQAIGTSMINTQKLFRTTPKLTISHANDAYTIRWEHAAYNSGFDHEIQFELGKHFMQKTLGAGTSDEVDTVFEVVDGRLVERQDHAKVKVTVEYELKDNFKDLNLVYRAGGVKAVRKFH